MFESLVVGIICLWLAKRIVWAPRYDMHKEVNRLQAENDRLNLKRKELLDQLETLLNTKREQLENSAKRELTGSLDEMVVTDALNREKRAKSALAALVRAHGCSEQQVQEVLNSIDNLQPGDAQ